MATDCLGDCVEKSAAAHSVWARDLEGFDFDFIARCMFAGTLGDLVFVEFIFLHQPIGEAQGRFCLGLWRVRVIGSLKNRPNFFSDAVVRNHTSKLIQGCGTCERRKGRDTLEVSFFIAEILRVWGS